MQKPKRSLLLFKDLGIIVLSILIAILLVRTGTISALLEATKLQGLLGSLLAGMFFTSIFTTAPAIVTLGELSRFGSILGTAFFGAIGAVLGDLIIFRFIKDRFVEHLNMVLQLRKEKKLVNAFLHLRYLRWFTFFLGGIIIASPLPDELGIGLLGVSKIPTKWFICISFAFNFIGILIIGLAANAL